MKFSFLLLWDIRFCVCYSCDEKVFCYNISSVMVYGIESLIDSKTMNLYGTRLVVANFS